MTGLLFCAMHKRQATSRLILPALFAFSLIHLASCSKREETKPAERGITISEGGKPSPQQIAVLSRPFPAVLLKDLNDKIIPSDQILQDRTTIVLFISPSCDPCTQEVEKWKDYLTRFRPPYQVIGISPDPVAELALYARAQGINFPVYSDPSGVLVEHFTLSTYPTIVGVTPTMMVKFILPGYSAKLSPARYIKAFGYD